MTGPSLTRSARQPITGASIWLEVGDLVDVAVDRYDVRGVPDELHRRRTVENELFSIAVKDRLQASVAFHNDQSAGVRGGRRALADTVPLTL